MLSADLSKRSAASQTTLFASDMQADRQAILRDLQTLNINALPGYDDFTRIAALTCESSAALVTLADDSSDWLGPDFVSLGAPTSVQNVRIFLVPDAAADPRFADTPLLTAAPYLRFFAEVPLVDAQGQVLGSLRVLDRQPRFLIPRQQEKLLALAQRIVMQMTLRRKTAQHTSLIAKHTSLIAEQTSLIAEQVQMTDALLQSRKRTGAIVSVALDCIISMDTDGRVIEWNPSAEKTFGWSRAEAMGQTLAELIIPENLRAAHAQGMARYLETGAGPVLNTRIEVTALRRDRTEFPVELTIVPLEEGRCTTFTAFLRDISVQKAAEQKLRLLAMAVENANDVILITEAEPIGLPGPRIVYVNDAFTRMTGYTSEDVLGKTPRILQGPGTSRETCDFLRRKLKAWKPVDVELLNYRKDGTPFWSHLNIRPVADENGWYTHWVSIQRDVTSRHDAEEAERATAQRREGELTTSIQENEARFRGVVEGLGEGILITDFDDIVLYASPRLEEITGWTCGEMLGRPAYEFLLAREDWPGLQHSNSQRKEGISECWEAYLQRKDGTSFWAENKATPFRDASNRIIGTLGAITDISIRKSLIDEKMRLSQRTELLLNSAGEGFFGLNLTGCNTFVNPAAAAMLGYAVEELLDAPMHALLHHSRPDGTHYPREECPIYAALTDGAVHHVTDEVFWRKDGTSFPVDYISTPIHEDGVLSGAVVTFRDISALKVLEAEQARNLAEALERADHDPLTGLLNHRAFQKKLEEEADRAQREDGSFIVAILDLDNFKFFNDAYGHAAGDDVLRQVAAALQTECRSYDTAARFGGDEFVLLLPGAQDSRKLTEVLMERLEHIGYCPPGYDTPIPIGATLGLAAFPDEAASRAEVVALADERLRRAKTGGGETEDLIAALRTRLPESSAEGFAMLTALVTAVDTKDRYTRRHSEDVLAYSLQIATELGLDEDACHTVAVAALLHDVGKVGVPDSVLRKPGSLTDAEFKAIQQHPVMGAAIVGAVPGFEETLDAVNHHHERWDGAGYPQGLRGEAIPLLARLMAVADAFSAMTTDRPYRKGMTEAMALSLLAEGARIQWDPQCVRAFLRARGSATVC